MAKRLTNIHLPRLVISKSTAFSASTSILSLVALSACRSPFNPIDAQGAVIKGPLSNAIVFFDYNLDGIVNSSLEAPTPKAAEEPRNNIQRF